MDLDEKSRILVVDDSLPILRMLRNMLEKQGYIVDTAKDGVEAVSIVRRSMIGLNETEEFKIECKEGSLNQVKYDCVLMDLQMPIMDGFEAVKQIRSLEVHLRSPTKQQNISNKYAHQLIIAMSANADSETVKQAFDAGVDQFIPKPVNLTALKNLLKS